MKMFEEMDSGDFAGLTIMTFGFLFFMTIVISVVIHEYRLDGFQFECDVARAREQLAARADALREADGMIHSVKGLMGGEPVFKDTRIPVRAIATMRNQGASVEELLEGYPSLSARMIELAEIWTAAHPARGRPKTLSEQGFLAKS